MERLGGIPFGCGASLVPIGVSSGPESRKTGFSDRPLESEVTTQGAECLQHVLHEIRWIGKPIPADSILDNIVDGSGYGARIVSHRCKPHSAFGKDSTSCFIIIEPMQPAVAGRHVEWPKESAAPRFFGALDLDIFRQKIKHLSNVWPVAIGAYNDPKGGKMPVPICAQQLDDFQESGVKRRFSTQQPNAPPLVASEQTFRDQLLDLFDGNIGGTGSLGTGAVAVRTSKVAPIGDIDFEIFPAYRPR